MSRTGCVRRHRRRAAATSGRRCSAACTVFFNAGVNAKSLPILMAVPVAILSALLFGLRRPFGLHVVFAFHFISFLLLVQVFLRPLQVLSEAIGHDGIDSEMAIVSLGASAWFFFVASRHVYGTHGVPRALKVLFLTGSVPVIWVGYRFAILVVTLYTTRL